MKALGAFLLLIALLFVAKPIGAASVYMGTLAADQPFTLHIDNGGNSTGKTIVTVIYYLTTGKPATKFDIHIVAAGARPSFLQVIPRGTHLITVEASPPSNATVDVEATQGAAAFPRSCAGGCTLMFDLQ
jgi:hypothetical protein